MSEMLRRSTHVDSPLRRQALRSAGLQVIQDWIARARIVDASLEIAFAPGNHGRVAMPRMRIVCNDGTRIVTGPTALNPTDRLRYSEYMARIQLARRLREVLLPEPEIIVLPDLRGSEAALIEAIDNYCRKMVEEANDARMMVDARLS